MCRWGGPPDIKWNNPFGWTNHTWTIIYHELAHDTFASLHMHYKNKPHQLTKDQKTHKWIVNMHEIIDQHQKNPKNTPIHYFSPLCQFSCILRWNIKPPNHKKSWKMHYWKIITQTSFCQIQMFIMNLVMELFKMDLCLWKCFALLFVFKFGF